MRRYRGRRRGFWGWIGWWIGLFLAIIYWTLVAMICIILLPMFLFVFI